MADFDPVVWVEDVTRVGPTNMNRIEQGITDASKLNRSGPLSARPAASAAAKNVIWTDNTGGSYYCDGTQWVAMSRRAAHDRAPVYLASQEVDNDPYALTDSKWASTTFVAARSGELRSLLVYVKIESTVYYANLSASLFTVAGGKPAATVGGTLFADLMKSQPLTSGGWVELRLEDDSYGGATPVVQAGQTYSIGLWYQGGGGEVYIGPGAAGSFWQADSSAGPWSNPLPRPPFAYRIGSKAGFTAEGPTDGSDIFNARTTVNGSVFNIDASGRAWSQGAPVGRKVQRGTLAFRPAAVKSNIGMIYYATDTAQVWWLGDDLGWRDLTGPLSWNVIGTAGKPAFANSWANYGLTWGTARYTKDASGKVTLSGLINGGALGTSAFTLPAGYRPGGQIMFNQITHSGAARVDVYPSGAVVPNITVPLNTSSYLSLNGIDFIWEA